MPILKSNETDLRFDLKIIASWVENNARVLDLGCGEGDLLVYLKKHKNVRGTGIDLEEENIFRCLEKGLSVIQGDINTEILDYSDNAFDYVILSQTLQQVFDPSRLLASLLRIGKKAVVSFPNFSHWKSRWQLLCLGKAPITPDLPYEWHNTPNIRVITMKDFRAYARKAKFCILKEAAIQTTHGRGRMISFLPDLMATYGIFLIANLKQGKNRRS